jgi:hypothetical protein
VTTSGSPSAGNDALTCPACGAENAPGSRFCERCGTRLPSRPRAEAEPASAPEVTQTFTLPPAGRPAEAGERTLVGIPTPPPADAERAPEPEPAQEEVAGPAPSFRDQPTMSFALPPAAPATSEEQKADTPPADIRNAPTISFALPQFDQPATPPTTDAPAETSQHGAEATLTGIELPSAPAPASQPESPPAPGQDEQAAPNWNYQAWAPPPPDAAPHNDTPAPAAMATQPSLPLLPPQPPAAPPAHPPANAPAAWPAPAVPRNAPSPAADAAPLPSMYPSPGQPPAATAGTSATPAVTQPVSPYPAPATTSGGGSNRTLWIILGGVAVLLIICALMCVGLLLIGAIGSSTTSAFATSAATVVP